MQNQRRNTNRQKEIIDICLTQFIENGLCNTSARDLAGALQMQPSGLYYHFKNKDEIVVACAEEAGIRLERILILPFLDFLDDTKNYTELLREKMTETIPMMHFFAQTCTTKEYRADMQPVMERLKERHKEYARQIAEKLECSSEEVMPYLCACVAVISNYMIFGEDFYYTQPFQLITEAIQKLKDQQERKKEMRS